MGDKRLFELARAQRLALALAIGCGLAGTVALIWQARALASVVDAVFLGRRALDGVAGLLLALLGLAFARGVWSWLGDLAATQVAARVKAGLRGRLFGHLLALGPAYAHGERSGELAQTLVGGVDELDAWYSQFLPQLALSLLIPLAILVVVFPLDALSGLVLLLTAPLIPLFMVLIGSISGVLAERQWASLSRMSAHFLDVLQGLTTLKLFGRSRRQVEVIARISDDFRRATLRVLRVAFLSALVLELVATLSTAVIAVEVGLRLLAGTIGFGHAFFILILAPEFYAPLRALGARFHAATSGKAAADRIFQVLETPTPDRPPSLAPTNEVPTGPLALRFEQVCYRYAGQRGDGRPALDDVSFSVPAGRMVAVVGPTGAGKSTLASLLLRFIEPASGAILVNGVPLAALDPDGWRARVAWVPQEPYLFAASVAENIRLARPDATDADVRAAARRAQAHEFIAALPRGYDTPLGERGERLSGGQRQRIALARAFLRDAPLLLCDEATSQLDAAAEAGVRAAMAGLLEGRTSLVIAHRLSTAAQADLIVVLDEGRVAGAGTHDALRATCPAYRRLVTAAEDAA